MDEPPFEDGADHDNATLPSPADAMRFCGAEAVDAAAATWEQIIDELIVINAIAIRVRIRRVGGLMIRFLKVIFSFL